MTSPFAAFSTSISRLVAAAAPMIVAVRIGPNRHVTGLLTWNDTIVTTDQALPAQDQYTVVLPSGELAAASPGPRDRTSNIAALRLGGPVPFTRVAEGSVALGGLIVVVAADHDASPTVRLTVVHRQIRTSDGPAPVPDLSANQIDPGAAALDADGRLIGMIALGPNGEAVIVPNAVIRQAFQGFPASGPSHHVARPTPAPSPNARGWLGVALQPITVPDALVPRTGQTSGRMVVNITPGGPAERGGLRVGDVLLTLNGTSASGPQALRAFLGADKIGSPVEVRLLRDGVLQTAQLIVAMQPG